MTNSEEDPLDQYPLYESGVLDRYPLYNSDIFIDIDNSDDTLELLCKESRAVINGQVDLISDIDDKAIRTFRINILLLGLILTAISIIIRYDSTNNETDLMTSFAEFVNIHMYGGIILLFLSIALAGFTYTFTSTKSGIHTEDIEITLKEAHDKDELYSRLVEGYYNWIEYNNDAIKYDAIFFTSTVLITINAIFFLLLGVGLSITTINIPFTEQSLSDSWIAFLIILLIVCFVEMVVYEWLP